MGILKCTIEPLRSKRTARCLMRLPKTIRLQLELLCQIISRIENSKTSCLRSRKQSKTKMTQIRFRVYKLTKWRKQVPSRNTNRKAFSLRAKELGESSQPPWLALLVKRSLVLPSQIDSSRSFLRSGHSSSRKIHSISISSSGFKTLIRFKSQTF